MFASADEINASINRIEDHAYTSALPNFKLELLLFVYVFNTLYLCALFKML